MQGVSRHFNVPILEQATIVNIVCENCALGLSVRLINSTVQKYRNKENKKKLRHRFELAQTGLRVETHPLC